jgi:hypothetical protein
MAISPFACIAYQPPRKNRSRAALRPARATNSWEQEMSIAVFEQVLKNTDLVGSERTAMMVMAWKCGNDLGGSLYPSMGNRRELMSQHARRLIHSLIEQLGGHRKLSPIPDALTLISVGDLPHIVVTNVGSKGSHTGSHHTDVSQ